MNVVFFVGYVKKFSAKEAFLIVCQEMELSFFADESHIIQGGANVGMGYED
jgi:hypothetical protein